MINLYDANNVFRRGMEQRAFVVGNQPRTVFLDANTTPGIHIHVWDGYNHNARRRELFEGYKIRPPVTEDIYTGLQFLREVLIHTPAIQIEVPEWEADDVIGTLARHYARNGQKVTVHSNDLDYFQLMDTPNITLNGVKNPTGIPAQYLPLYKALVGDPSDKIPGIPGFGIKTFVALEPYWDKMIEYITYNGWYDDIPFKPSHKAWIIDNQDLIYSYWKIVHLWPVDLDLISDHTYPGVPNQEAGEDLLRKYFL